MEEKEKEYQPILPAHPENEQPEEGFVPYCGSEEAENEQRDPKKKLLLLLIMIALLVLIIAVSMVLKKSNYYHTVLRNLRFDYRGGEFVFADSLDDPGERSYALAEEIDGKPVNIQTAMYMFDDEEKIQDLVTEYVYSHNSSEDTLDIQVGSENALFKKSYSYRRNSSGYQIKKGGEWKSDSEAYIPKLNEYFFGTENHGGMLFECQEASMVSVNGKDYTCELWLMEDNSGSKTVYTTIYRYFNGSRLAGVRILFDFDKLMEVYDVKSYTIG